MKNLNYLNDKRVELYGNYGDEYNGAFKINYQGTYFTVLASNGGGWEHVSVSNNRRTPDWEVMCKIKEMFFEDDEVVMQLHPAKKDYINVHEHCLHLWRPLNNEIPMPAKIFV